MTKKRIAILMTVLFIVGAFAGAAIRTSKQETEIETLEYFAEVGLGVKMDSVEAEKGLVESLVDDFMETGVKIMENNLAITYVEQFVRDEL